MKNRPDAGSISPAENISLRFFGPFEVAAMLGVAILGMFLLGMDVVKDLRLLQTASSDNVQWTLSQVEVEYLEYEKALDTAILQPEGDLALVRRNFDVFFSRITTLRTGKLYAGLQDVAESAAALAKIHVALDYAVPFIDASDDQLRAMLPELDEHSDELREDLRKLSTAGLRYFAQQADLRRVGISETLFRLAIVTGLLVSALIILALHSNRVSRQNLRRRNEVLQTSARLQTVISTSLDAVIVTDISGLILEFNGAAEQIFGHSREDALGQSIGELIVPVHLREAHKAGMKRMAVGGEHHVVGKGRVRLEGMRATGEIFPIEMSIQSATRDDQEIFVAFMRDISTLVKSERELVDARDRALAGEKAKANFLAVMSHEIRTPLNGLLGNLTLLKDTAMDAKQRDLARRMDMSGRLLMNHVNDVLDIAKYEAGKLRLLAEPVNLTEMLQDLADAQSTDAAAVGTTLKWHWVGAPQLWVSSDRARLEQLLLNLVGNAIKFTRKGRVSIEAEVISRSGDTAQIEFRVADTGIGIAAEDVERIFGDFETLDSSYGRSVGGTGLGLGIARRITSAFGGEIGAESVLGSGTVFKVRLPIKVAEAPIVVAEAPAPSDALALPVRQSRNILVVEDNEVNRHVARQMLQRDGHRVSEANDGQDAVDRAAVEKFDMIFMDISMPVMDGRHATRAIRAGGGASAGSPIIAFTANVMPDEVATFLTDGMDGALSKPISGEALRQVIDQFGGGRTMTTASDAAPIQPSNLLDLERIAETRDLIGEENFVKLLGRFEIEMDELAIWLGQGSALPHNEIEARCHKIASTAGTFGATDLRLALMAAEKAARGTDDRAIHEACEKVIALWAETRGCFHALDQG